MISRAGFLVLAGCNQIFGIDPTRPVDAAVIVIMPDAPDQDLDLVADADDNCPSVANTNQADSDGDKTGDMCDDCPMVANAQGFDNDLDGVGDACDPHPIVAGDCLILFESFDDPDHFADHWSINTTNTTPVVTLEKGDVILRYQPGFNLGILSKDITGLVDVEVKAISATGNAVVMAVSGVAPSQGGYACSLQEGNGVVVVYGPTCTTVSSALVPPPGGAHDAFVRLFVDDQGSVVTSSCRADFGFSTGVTTTKSCDRLLTGSPGVTAAGEDVTVEAIAVIRSQPGQACTTVRR